MKVGIEIEANYPTKKNSFGHWSFNDSQLSNDLGEIFGETEIYEDGHVIAYNKWEALEFHTPPLSFDGKNTRKSFGKVRKTLSILQKHKARGCYGCGIHIHVSMKDNWKEERDKGQQNFLRFVFPRQELFFTVGDSKRIQLSMCGPIDLDIRDNGLKTIANYYNEGGKYSGVNFHRLYPTIEFRYFPSLPDYDTMKTWIELCIETVRIGYRGIHPDIVSRELSFQEMIKPYSNKLQRKLIVIKEKAKNPRKFFYA